MGDGSAARLRLARLPVSSHWALPESISAVLTIWRPPCQAKAVNFIWGVFVWLVLGKSGVGLIFLSWTVGLRLLPKGADQGS